MKLAYTNKKTGEIKDLVMREVIHLVETQEFLASQHMFEDGSSDSNTLTWEQMNKFVLYVSFKFLFINFYFANDVLIDLCFSGGSKKEMSFSRVSSSIQLFFCTSFVYLSRYCGEVEEQGWADYSFGVPKYYYHCSNGRHPNSNGEEPTADNIYDKNISNILFII